MRFGEQIFAILVSTYYVLHIPILSKQYTRFRTVDHSVYAALIYYFLSRFDSWSYMSYMGGATAYKTCSCLLYVLMTRCPPPRWITHSANCLAMSGSSANVLIKICAGFNNGSSKLSVEALNIVNWLVRDGSKLKNVPRSVSVYSPRRIAAVKAWRGKAIYWWYQVV